METSTIVFLVIVGGFLLYLYFLPAIQASTRGHPDTQAILVLNILLGWLFVPWVIALVWAYKGPTVVRNDDAPPARTRRCPFCDEEIRVAAVKCKHCGSDVARHARVEA